MCASQRSQWAAKPCRPLTSFHLNVGRNRPLSDRPEQHKSLRTGVFDSIHSSRSHSRTERKRFQMVVVSLSNGKAHVMANLAPDLQSYPLGHHLNR